MLQTFETDRLYLRKRELRDLESCISMDLEPGVLDYIPELNKIINSPNSKMAHQDFVRMRFETDYPNGMGYWTIETKEENERFAGWVLLIPQHKNELSAEIGWRLRPRYWGKGYATEASAIILHYAITELKLKEVAAEIHKENKGSIRVAEKID